MTRTRQEAYTRLMRRVMQVRSIDPATHEVYCLMDGGLVTLTIERFQRYLALGYTWETWV